MLRFFTAMVFVVLSSSILFAQGGLNEEARQQILSTAESICGKFSSTGFSKDISITGVINTELEGLAKRLVDLGVEGAASNTPFWDRSKL